MENIKFKRIMAYLIDLFIISFIVFLLSNVKFINPNANKRDSLYKEYIEYSESIANTTDVNAILSSEYGELYYKLNYYSMSYTITEIVVMILYFTLFPFFFEGQTIGKRLLKIKIVDSDDKNPNMWKLFVRSLILPIAVNIIMYTVGSNIITLLGLLVFKDLNYVYFSVGVSLVMGAIALVDVIMMLSSKDETALHDKLLKLKVVKC